MTLEEKTPKCAICRKKLDRRDNPDFANELPRPGICFDCAQFSIAGRAENVFQLRNVANEKFRTEPDIGPRGHFSGRSKPKKPLYEPGVPTIPLSAIPAALVGASKLCIPVYRRSDKFLPSHAKPFDALTGLRKVKTPRPSTAFVPLRQQQKQIEQMERDAKRGVQTAPAGGRQKTITKLEGDVRFVREGHGTRTMLLGRAHSGGIKPPGAISKGFTVVSYSVMSDFKTQKEFHDEYPGCVQPGTGWAER